MSRTHHPPSILSEPAETRGADTLTFLDVSVDMLDAYAANDGAAEESGEFLVFAEETVDVEELTDDEVAEVSPESTVTIGDVDIEVLEPAPRQPVIRQVTPETVLIYCKAGDTLPPYAVPTGELPRFALRERRRPLPRFEEVAPVASGPKLPPPRLPRFELESAAPARKVPAAVLPRFPITEPLHQRRIPPVRLPAAMRTVAPAHTIETCPHCRHIAMMKLARAC